MLNRNYNRNYNYSSSSSSASANNSCTNINNIENIDYKPIYKTKEKSKFKSININSMDYQTTLCSRKPYIIINYYTQKEEDLYIGEQRVKSIKHLVLYASIINIEILSINQNSKETMIIEYIEGGEEQKTFNSWITMSKDELLLEFIDYYKNKV